MNYPSIAKTIINLKNADIKLRDELILNGQLGHDYNQELQALHNDNAASLNEIINQIGLPTYRKVGEEASKAAWLIIQHSIAKPTFMKRCAQLLKKEVGEHNFNPQLLAYLSDRIAVFEEKMQRFGTQFDWDENGNLSPSDFDDLETVNERRASIGLNSIEEQTVIIRAQANAENRTPPPDYEQRLNDFKKWKKKVGWIM